MKNKTKKKPVHFSESENVMFSLRDSMIERVKTENYFLEGDIRFVETSTAMN